MSEAVIDAPERLIPVCVGGFSDDLPSKTAAYFGDPVLGVVPEGW